MFARPLLCDRHRRLPKNVVARPALDEVVAISAVDKIFCDLYRILIQVLPTLNCIISSPTMDRVASSTTIDVVVPATSKDGIISAAALNCVSTLTAVEVVVAPCVAGAVMGLNLAAVLCAIEIINERKQTSEARYDEGFKTEFKETFLQPSNDLNGRTTKRAISERAAKS